MDELLATFGPDVLRAWATTWVPRILIALLIAVAGWGVSRLLASLLGAVFRQVDLDRTASVFVLTVVRFTVGIVTGLAALDHLGVDTTAILTSLGVVGLTLGFAAQNTLSNLISGLFIFWDRPFVIGDLVEVDGISGRVETITLRSTRLVTPDGRMIAMPNQMIANSRVASYTNFPHLRIDVPVSVALDTDLGRVRQLLLALVREDPDYLAEPAPEVVVTALNDYNIGLELRAWLGDEKRHLPKRFALREQVFATLDTNGIEMPFETLQLRPITVREAPPT